jgi:hypothetical protein
VTLYPPDGCDEVILIRESGVYPSTLATIRQRLDARVAAGDFSAEIADQLLEASPFHQQADSRSNKFWVTSHPIEHDDSSVELLLGNWGGEGVYFWLEDEGLKNLVAKIGKPRVLEMAVPINASCRSHQTAAAVLCTFGRSIGCKPSRAEFHLYSTHALGPEAVIAIHTEAEPNFVALARGYPVGFKHEELENQ